MCLSGGGEPGVRCPCTRAPERRSPRLYRRPERERETGLVVSTANRGRRQLVAAPPDHTRPRCQSRTDDHAFSLFIIVSLWLQHIPDNCTVVMARSCVVFLSTRGARNPLLVCIIEAPSFFVVSFFFLCCHFERDFCCKHFCSMMIIITGMDYICVKPKINLDVIWFSEKPLRCLYVCACVAFIPRWLY